MKIIFLETESWHLVSGPGVGSNPSPPPRHKHSAVFHDQAMWIYGGMTDLHERADFWKWDAGKIKDNFPLLLIKLSIPI